MNREPSRNALTLQLSRERRRRLGRCTQCPRKAAPEHRQCAEHLAAARTPARRAQHAAAKRRAYAAALAFVATAPTAAIAGTSSPADLARLDWRALRPHLDPSTDRGASRAASHRSATRAAKDASK